MNKSNIVRRGLLSVVLGIALFHVVHHHLYCRFRGVKGKSHCAVCGHREICRKYHKNHFRNRAETVLRRHSDDMMNFVQIFRKRGIQA